MNIAFDAKRLFQNFTGLGNYSRTLVQNLVKYFPEDNFHLFSPEIRQHPSTSFFLNHPSVKVHTAPHPFHAVWRSLDIKTDIIKCEAKIYHGLSHEIPIGIDSTPVKSVVTMHDLVFKIYPEYTPVLQRKIYDAKFRYACAHSDVIIAISEQTKKDIVHFYQIDPQKIKVIYQSCGDVFQQQDFSAALLRNIHLPPEYMLYVGSVIERKNLLRIIKAIDLLADSIRIPLVVVGEGGSYMEKVKACLAEKKWKDQVHFIGNVANTDLPALYRGASLFIYPSEYEGFGIPVIEALFSEVPVITSNVSCLPEAAGPSSLLVNPKSEVEIARAIETALCDDARRKSMIADGLRYARDNFSAEKVTAQVHYLYRELLD
jgi:glycosyltransferase involved in cell wall biosynthesis